MDYRDLDRLIEQLNHFVHDDAPQKGYWRELWNIVGQVRGGLREVRYPTGQEKADARKRLDHLISEAQSRSEREKEARAEKERAWEERKQKSGDALGRVQSKVANATPISEFERMIATVILAPLELLESALRSVLGLPELDAILEDLKKCSAALRDAWQIFNESKNAFLPGDKQVAYRQLAEAQDRLNRAWEAWKASKNEYHEEQRRIRDQKQREWEKRQEDRGERIRANIDKLEEKREKAEEALRRRRDHLAELEDKLEGARTDEYADRVRDWIREEEDRIENIEESIQKFNGWLEEERRKLRG